MKSEFFNVFDLFTASIASLKWILRLPSNISRAESTHISQTIAFQNAKMEILDENGLDSELKMKKGEKYQIKFDLEDSLTPNCQEKNQKLKIFKISNQKTSSILNTA